MIVNKVPTVPFTGDIEVTEPIVQRVARNCNAFDDVGIVWLHKLALIVFEEHVELDAATKNLKFVDKIFSTTTYCLD